MTYSNLYYRTRGLKIPEATLETYSPKRRRRVSIDERVRDTKLERINARLAEGYRLIHPTKGFRRFTIRRARLAAIVQAILGSQVSPGGKGWGLDIIRKVLREGF